MLTKLKYLLLTALERRGYFVLKQADYERLKQAADASGVVQARSASPARFAADISLALDASPVERFGQFTGHMAGRSDIHPSRLLAIFLIADYLTRAEIAGSVVDCGDGLPPTIAAFASAFVWLGSTARQLLICDTTIHPAHRAVADLRAWGNDHDVIRNAAMAPTRGGPEALPRELSSSGYPAENLYLCRLPDKPAVAPQGIAFLGVTDQTYEANLAALRFFAPQVRRGGVVAISGDLSRPPSPRVVQLAEQEHGLLFWPVTGGYFVGVKC